MYNDNLEQLLKFNKTLSTPINEWSKAMTDMSKRITEQNLELFSDQFSRISNHLKQFSTIRKPEDLLTLQKDIFAEILTLNIETTQKIMHMTFDNIEAFSKLWETNTKKVAEKSVEKI